MGTDTKKLTGKVALVTGASRGIGAAIAKGLAADGASIAITYTSSPQKADEVVRAIEAAGGKALAIQADSADAAAVNNAVTSTVKKFGRLDILVNNAGVLALGPIEEFKVEDFDRLIAINVKGVFLATQAAVRHMKDGGRIINIGSVNSDSMPFAGGSVYALTKGAVASFTRGLARDLGPRGITVNNIQPGPIDTDMNPADGAFAPQLKELMALKRYGHGNEIAALVSFLASPEAGFITGTGIKIDGGFDA
jgi:3-oxoacyl-[acyl-carrier protein] reductase